LRAGGARRRAPSALKRCEGAGALTGLTWAAVVRRLAATRSVWLSTTTPGGAPHAAPVWIAVTDDVAHVFSYRGTRKARNLAADARVLLHLPDPEDVLIVEGRLRDLGRPEDAPDVVAAFAEKYPAADDQAYLPGVDPSVDVLYALEPDRALAWRLADFEESQQRWAAAG
jgi:hypothetical protein